MCDVDVTPSVSDSRWQRARKKHVCIGCQEPVRVGDLYHVLTGCWDGEWERFRHCARCWQMVRALQGITSEPVDLYLDCGETYEAERDDDPILALAFLTPDEAQEWALQDARRG